MVQANPSNQPFEPDESPLMASSGEVETEAGIAVVPSNSPNHRWIMVVGLLVTLLGLGLGWRWWVARQQAGAGAMGGMPPGVPVQLDAVKTATLQESSEFIGALESENSVTIRPEISGQVSDIYVTKGQRVTAGTPLVQLSADQRQADVASVLASVNSARAIRSNARSQLEALQADRIAQVAEVDLQTQDYGRVEKLVAAGALAEQDLDQAKRDRDAAIATLSALDRRIEAARASLSEAESGLGQAQANADRASADLSDATVIAPFDGIVGDIPVKLGDVVSTTSTLTTVTRNQVLSLRLAIPLERSPDLKIGQRVELIDPQGKVLQTGKVRFISPQVDISAQTVLTEASFDNQGGLLRDGQFVRARIIWQERPGVLVPTSAITRVAGEPFVFVATPPEAPASSPDSAGDSAQAPTAPPSSESPAGAAPALIARQRRIKVGEIQNNQYQVLDGLKAGEQIVTSGVLNLSDGVPIIPAPPPGQTPGQPPQ